MAHPFKLLSSIHSSTPSETHGAKEEHLRPARHEDPFDDSGFTEAPSTPSPRRSRGPFGVPVFHPPTGPVAKGPFGVIVEPPGIGNPPPGPIAKGPFGVVVRPPPVSPETPDDLGIVDELLNSPAPGDLDGIVSGLLDGKTGLPND